VYGGLAVSRTKEGSGAGAEGAPVKMAGRMVTRRRRMMGKTWYKIDVFPWGPGSAAAGRRR